MLIIDSLEKKMEAIPLDEIELIDRAIKVIEPKLMIQEVNYSKGVVKIAFNRNVGTPNEWCEENFLEVNVACDSNAAVLCDVINKVRERCL